MQSGTRSIFEKKRSVILRCSPFFTTGLGELRDRTHCVTIMGEQSKADVVAMRVGDGDKVMKSRWSGDDWLALYPLRRFPARRSRRRTMRR
jgi:hypothetical protein